MTSEKLVCLFVFLVTFFKGNYSLDSRQVEVTEATLSEAKQIRLENKTSLAGGLHSGSTESNSKINLASPEQTTGLSEFSTKGTNSTNVKSNELIEIFHGVLKNVSETKGITVSSTIITTECINGSSVNVTCVEPSWNNIGKTNYTLVAEAAEALNSDVLALRPEKLAAIAAGVFLVSAVIGYLSCIGYRRFLQRKYGNSQVLIAEEVYDTTDLRYFEI